MTTDLQAHERDVAVAPAAFDLEALRPADTPAYMTPAWLGALSFSLGRPDIVSAFRADTGNTWTPARDGLSIMIDQATGVDRAFFVQFVEWFNVHVWGPVS